MNTTFYEKSEISQPNFISITEINAKDDLNIKILNTCNEDDRKPRNSKSRPIIVELQEMLFVKVCQNLILILIFYLKILFFVVVVAAIGTKTEIWCSAEIH